MENRTLGNSVTARYSNMAVRMVVHLYRVNLAKELKEQAAPLIAATLPSPVSSNCPIPRDAVALYRGNTVSVVTEFPHVIFRVHGEDVLALDPDASGLLISFTAFDDGCNVVGRLNRTVFTAINSASHVERPSASNLAVFDDRDTKVLDVQFLNPQTIKILGILRFPGNDPIVITEKYLGIGGSISPPECRAREDADSWTRQRLPRHNVILCGMRLGSPTALVLVITWTILGRRDESKEGPQTVEQG
jgi:hypothetical protein